MPSFERAGTTIYYEEHGQGFPVLLFAPGGMRSAISFLPRVAYDPVAAFAKDFRLIAVDQRNNGKSHAPLHASDGWHSYREDHVALLDHLKIERAHLHGTCIGPSFALRLLVDAPERVASAVLQQPIGATEESWPAFRSAFDDWASAIAPQHPEASASDFAAVRERMFGTDFVFSATKEEVRAIRRPLLLLSGSDLHHPAETSRELAAVAHDIEVVEAGWKAPEQLASTIERVRTFLKSH